MNPREVTSDRDSSIKPGGGWVTVVSKLSTFLQAILASGRRRQRDYTHAADLEIRRCCKFGFATSNLGHHKQQNLSTFIRMSRTASGTIDRK